MLLINFRKEYLKYYTVGIILSVLLDEENYIPESDKYEVIKNGIATNENDDIHTFGESKSSVGFRDHVSWINDNSSNDFMQLQSNTSNTSNNFNGSSSRNLWNKEIPQIFPRVSSKEDVRANTGSNFGATLNDCKSISFQGSSMTVVNDKIKELNQLIQDYRNKTTALAKEREQIVNVRTVVF